MMVQTHVTIKYSTIIVRWIARIWGVASILFVLAFLLGEGLALTHGDTEYALRTTFG